MRWRISKQRRAAAKRMCGYLRFLLYVVVVACAQLLSEMVVFFSSFPSFPHLLYSLVSFSVCLGRTTSAVKRSIIGSELNTVSPGMSAHNRRTVHKFGKCVCDGGGGVMKYYNAKELGSIKR